jgi:RND family efflux transporter MFP subunit
LERTEIRSPITGVIQRLNAYPGRKVMAGSDNPESLTLAVIFDPASLQARIDVPLEEAAKLQVGQLARVRSNLLPNQSFRGRVTRIVGESDLQRNTLQAKVELLETDPRMRPEMLCRVEFLETAAPAAGAGGRKSGRPDSLSLFVPESAIVQRSGEAAEVFMITPDRARVQRVAVRLGGESGDSGFIQVVRGLKPGDQVVLNPSTELKDQDRIRIQTME